MQVQIMFPMFLTLISMLLTGGPKDLLGYISTDAYWKSKHVAISIEQLAPALKEPSTIDVAKLIAELASEDPKIRDKASAKILKTGPGALPQLREAMRDPDAETASRARALVAKINDNSKASSVRQLMAIRTLGEMKNPDALPLLRPLLNSKTPFVPEYAAHAIAMIEGKPIAITPLPVEKRMQDVNLLPGKIDMAGQVSPVGSVTPMPFDRIIDRMQIPLSEDRKRATIEQGNQRLIQIADLMGNIQVDCVTLGWWTAPQNQPGHAVLIGRGQYDSKSAADALRKAEVERKIVQRMEVFMLDDETALLLPDDHVAILVAAETNGEVPIAQTIMAFKSGTGDFETNNDLARLVQATDVKQPFWIATKVNDGLRQFKEVLNPFDTVTLTATPSNDPSKVNLKLSAAGTDPANVKAAVDDAKTSVQQDIEQGKMLDQASPTIHSVLTFDKGIKLSSAGATATATAPITADEVLAFLKAWREMRVGNEISPFWDQ